MLINLESDLSNMRHQVGEKAFNLYLLNTYKYPVPFGYVLPSTFFHELLQLNGCENRFNELVYHSNDQGRFDQIQDLVSNLKIPESVQMEIEKCFVLLGSKVAVRSSSPFEDGFQTSSAGLFQSFTAITSIDQTLTSILHCYASAFTQDVYSCSPHFGESIAVILQAYVPFEVGGVLFTCDPLTKDLTKIVVNAGKGGIEQVVEGDFDGSVYHFSKAGDHFEIDLLSLEQVTTLIQMASELESKLGYPIDVEWGFENNKLYLVQVRPIVFQHSSRNTKEDTYFVSVDEAALFGSIYLNPDMYKAHLKWLNKKHRVRSVCREVGIQLPDVRYVYIPPDMCKAEKIINEYSNSIHFRYIEIYDGTSYTIIEPSSIYSYCQFASQNFGLELSFRIQEFQETQYCGYATIIKDIGKIYVESLPGMFKGFWSEGLTPAVFLLSSTGEILEATPCQVNGFYEFDPIRAKAIWNQEPRNHTIGDDVASEIALLCNKLSTRLGEVRIEWIHDGEKVQFFDLSEESRALLEVNGSENYLSIGSIEGRVHRLDNIDMFDSLFTNYLYEIDVVPTPSYKSVVSSSEAQSLIKQVTSDQKPVIVADFPKRTLAVLADYVSGFIFKRGALLCHLAIILREKGIPAIVLPNIDDLAQEGESIQVIDGQIYIQREEGVK